MAGSNKTTEIKINLTDLPTTATTYLRATFTQMVLVSARKVTKNESVTYVVKLKVGLSILSAKPYLKFVENRVKVRLSSLRFKYDKLTLVFQP